MRSRLAKFIQLATVLTLGFLLNSCGSQPFCPTCDDGEWCLRRLECRPRAGAQPYRRPGGPFNSFDMLVRPNQQKCTLIALAWTLWSPTPRIISP
jgi:hypothetical protein